MGIKYWVGTTTFLLLIVLNIGWARAPVTPLLLRACVYNYDRIVRFSSARSKRALSFGLLCWLSGRGSIAEKLPIAFRHEAEPSSSLIWGLIWVPPWRQHNAVLSLYPFGKETSINEITPIFQFIEPLLSYCHLNYALKITLNWHFFYPPPSPFGVTSFMDGP